MSTSFRILTYVWAAMAGAIVLVTLSWVGETSPIHRYRQGVKDCMTGRAKVEIKADTLVTFP